MSHLMKIAAALVFAGTCAASAAPVAPEIEDAPHVTIALPGASEPLATDVANVEVEAAANTAVAAPQEVEPLLASILAIELNPLAILQAAHFVTGVDIAAWAEMSTFLETQPPAEPWRRTGIDAARVALKARIAREGYTAENLAAAQAIKARAAAQNQ